MPLPTAFLASTPIAARQGFSSARFCRARHALPYRVCAAPAPARMSAIPPATAKALIGVYGVVVAGGGLGAYAKSKSAMSAVSGVVSGVVLAAAFATDNVPLAFGTALALAAVFTVRYVKTKKLMPSGMLLGLSLAFAAAFAAAIF